MKHIAVASDISRRSTLAVARATELARRFDAMLTVIHVIPGLRADAEGAAWEAQAALEDEVVAAPHPLLSQPQFVVRSGPVAETITSVVDEIEADLLVAGVHRRRILFDRPGGRTIEGVLRKSKIPILIANDARPKAYREILAAVDFSYSSLRALRLARRLRLLDTAHLTLLHAFTAPAKDAMLHAGVEAALVHQHVAKHSLEAHRRLSGVPRVLAFDERAVSLSLFEGMAGKAVRAAIDERSPDLLVIGNGGSGDIDAAGPDSVVASLLRSVDIDIFVAPAKPR